MNKSYSLHHITSENLHPFDPAAYSLFKFGQIAIAKAFAKDLFDGFIAQFGPQIIATEKEIVILPSPFLSIPTASNALCAYFKHYLNAFLCEHDKNAAIESKIYRNQTYTTDYGALDYEQRLKLISNDTYYIDKHFLDQKFCIFVDDIKITGSHEHTVNRILQDYHVQGDFVFVYYAELKDRNIQPNIENYYNYFAIKEAKDIINLVNLPNFAYNTRVVKYILSFCEKDFALFLAEVSEEKQATLFHLAISNNYHQIKKYQPNINFLKKLAHGN